MAHKGPCTEVLVVQLERPAEVRDSLHTKPESCHPADVQQLDA